MTKRDKTPISDVILEKPYRSRSWLNTKTSTQMFICTLKFNCLLLCCHAGCDADVPPPVAVTGHLAFSSSVKHNSAWGGVKECDLGIIYSYPSRMLSKHTFEAGICFKDVKDAYIYIYICPVKLCSQCLNWISIKNTFHKRATKPEKITTCGSYYILFCNKKK